MQLHLLIVYFCKVYILADDIVFSFSIKHLYVYFKELLISFKKFLRKPDPFRPGFPVTRIYDVELWSGNKQFFTSIPILFGILNIFIPYVCQIKKNPDDDILRPARLL